MMHWDRSAKHRIVKRSAAQHVVGHRQDPGEFPFRQPRGTVEIPPYKSAVRSYQAKHGRKSKISLPSLSILSEDETP